LPPVFLNSRPTPPRPSHPFFPSPSPPTPLPSKLALPVSMPDPDGAPRPPPPPTPLWRCGLARCLRLEEDALLVCRDVLRWW
jgi:hypothetical protein